MPILLYTLLAILFFVLVHKHDARFSGSEYPRPTDTIFNVGAGIFWPVLIFFLAIDYLTDENRR